MTDLDLVTGRAEQLEQLRQLQMLLELSRRVSALDSLDDAKDGAKAMGEVEALKSVRTAVEDTRGSADRIIAAQRTINEQVEKELLTRTTESRQRELTGGRTRMRELRGGDVAAPEKE